MLLDSGSAMPRFTADLEGSYQASLTVSDGQLDSSADQVTVIASVQVQPNNAPEANAGGDQTVSTGQRSVLDGSNSFDADGDSLSYLWRFVSRPSGSNAILANVALPNAEFTPDVDGSYLLELTVSDGSSSDTDRVLVVSASGNSACGNNTSGHTVTATTAAATAAQTPHSTNDASISNSKRHRNH